MPEAPQTTSPVPWLTSIHATEGRGEYGKSGYRGNCGGYLIKDLLRYYRPREVLDPMTGGGTCKDVCAELEIPCVSLDVKNGFDAASPAGYGEIGTFDFIWTHPPYWQMIRYGDDPRCLSNAPTLADFMKQMRQMIRNCRDVLSPGGKLAILIGGYSHKGRYLPLAALTMGVAIEEGLWPACTEIIRLQYGNTSSKRAYDRAFIPGLQRHATEPISNVILTGSGRSPDRRSLGPLVVGRLAPLSIAVTSRSRIMRSRYDGSVPPRAGRRFPALKRTIHSG